MGEGPRLAELESRLRAVEDQLEILRLLSSYGPAVDSGSAAEAADLWLSGGGYEFGLREGGTKRLEAPAELAALYESDLHVKMIQTGVAHVTSLPQVTVSGDRAQAVGYSFVLLREGDRWYLSRSAINRWSVVRTTNGWRIKERQNRILDGSPESRELMRGGRV